MKGLPLFLAALCLIGAVADSKPSWFAQDYRSPAEWGFYCSGDGKTEDEALGLARANCANKICLLFGVEVESSTTTRETLQDVSVTSSVIEKCPKVRVVGRIEKRKSVACADESCSAYLLQLYPKAQYDKEYQRLNQPAISKVLEKTIIVRENNETFRDPAKCREQLKSYSEVRGEKPPQFKARIALLKTAAEECKGLDYRNVNVQEELRSYLAIGMQSRALTGAMALGKELQTAATLESKISGFSAFEQAQLGAEARLPALEKLIRERYDALYSRDNFKTDEQKYVLFDGSRSDTNPYIEELETCRRLSEVMLAWPGNVSSEVTVCLPQLNSAGEDCQTSSILMLRWQFAGCVCRARAPRVDQKCTGLVGQLIAETCPGEMTRDCYARVARLTAEQMSIDIRLPALATAAAAPGTPR